MARNQLKESDKMLKTYHHSSNLRKNFHDYETQKGHAKENARLASRFNDIFNKGCDLAVGHHVHQKNLGPRITSPIVEQHSINYTGRK